MWDSKLKDFITDNFFLTIPLFEKLYLNDKGTGTVIKFRGGKQIDSTILYNAPTTSSYGPGGTFDTSIVQIVTDLVFQWKQVYTPINIDGLSLAKFAGGPETALFDYMEKLGEAAFQSHAQALNTMAYGDGTGNGGLDFDGMAEAVDDGNTYSTYGGITRSSTAGTPGAAIKGYVSSTSAPMSKALLQSAWQNVVFNKWKPDLICTTRTLFSKLWDHVEGADRNREGGPLRSVGFDTIHFNGAEVVYDDECPTGFVYGFNTAMIQLWFLSGNAFVRRSTQYGFKDTGFPVANQDLSVDQLISYGNLICNGPRYCFKLSNVF